jgi:hypothetical protein
MKNEIKKFNLKINGKVVVDIEVAGNKAILDSFEKQVFTDTFGIFHEWKKEIGKMILNEIEVSLTTVFRDKKGKFINLNNIIEADSK